LQYGFIAKTEEYLCSGAEIFSKNVVRLHLKVGACPLAGNRLSRNSIESGAMESLIPSWLRLRGSLGALTIAACLSACAALPPDSGFVPAPPAMPIPPVVEQTLPMFEQVGLASWYAGTRKHKRTASGELMANNALTAAHRSLPMNTIVRVTNLNNGLSVLVRINDRGPFIDGRVIDLSPGAAMGLNMKQAGVARVRLEVDAADQRPKSSQTLAMF
jgi:hypothetical protein